MFQQFLSRVRGGNGPRGDPLAAMAQAWEYNLYHLMRDADVPIRVVDRARGPQLFTMTFRLLAPDKLDTVLKQNEKLALVLNVDSARLVRRAGFVQAQVVLPQAFRRPLYLRRMDLRGGFWATLGQTPDGEPVHINMVGTRTCHAAIVGTTGSGKTVTQKVIAYNLIQGTDRDEMRLILIDAKGGVDWWGFQRAPHLAHPIIKEMGDAAGALAWVVVELERRKVQSYNHPKIFVIIDEIKHLIDHIGPAAEMAVSRISEVGRGLGVHVTVSTQYATAKALGGSIVKANLPLRITGRVTDANAAALATGVPRSGAEQLQGRGDFLITVAGESHRVQIGMIEDRDLGRMPQVETTEQQGQIAIGEFSLDRVLGLVDEAEEDEIGPPPEIVAHILAHNPPVRETRETFAIGMQKASDWTRYARAIRAEMEEEGCYPLLVTELSPETARKAGIGGGE